MEGEGGEEKKLCPYLEVLMDLEWFRWEAYQDRSVEPGLSLCEAFYQT